MKKTLALVLSALMVAMSIPTFAVELEAPEALDETPATAVEAEELEDDLGTLIWAADFEDAGASLVDNTDKLTKAYGSYANEDYPEAASIYLRDAQQTNAVKFAIEDGALKITQSGAAWRMVGIYAGTKFADYPGTYTITFDMYCPTKASFNWRWYRNCTPHDSFTEFPSFTIGGTDAYYPVTHAWTVNSTKETYEFELAKSDVNTADATQLGPFAKKYCYSWNDVWLFYGSMAATDTEFYIDNVKLYYKPANVVTFDLSKANVNAANVIKANMALKQVIAVGDPLPDATVTGSGFAFNGWEDADGTPVTAASENLTVYPILEELAGFDIGADKATTFVASEEGDMITISKTTGDMEIYDWTVEASNEFCYSYEIDEDDPEILYLYTYDEAGVIKVTASSEDEGVIRTIEVHVLPMTEKVGSDVVIRRDKVHPGLNVFNGAPTPWTFDDGRQYFEFSPSEIDVDPTDSTNKVWKLSGTGAYNSIGVEMWHTSGTPYTISFMRRSATTASAASATTTWWTSNTNNPTPSFSGNATDWVKYSYNGTKAARDAKMTINHKNNSSDLTGSGIVNTDWYDDFVVMPWYKITYHELDNTETVEWVDPYTTEYTPKAGTGSAFNVATGKIETLAGWATPYSMDDFGNPVAEEVVYLAYEDVDLYPVFDEVDFDGDIVMDSLSTYSLTSDSAITVVDEFGVAEIIGNGTNEVTIKGLGYNGVVTADGYTIKLVGNHNYKPGLNIFTGTDAALDFENTDAATLNTEIFTLNKNISDNPAAGIALINDGTNSFLKLQAPAGGTYPSSRMSLGTSIETVRPMQMSAKAHGTFASFWIMSQGSGGTDIVVQFDASKLQGDEFKAATAKYAGKTYAAYTSFTGLGVEAGLNNSGDIKELYIDDLSIIPAYKITFVDKDNTYLRDEYYLWDAEGNLATEWYPEATSGITYYVNGVEVNEANPYQLAYKDFTVKVEGAANAVTFGSAAIMPEEDTFIVPTPDELGITIDYFVTWLDADGNVVNPGTELITADYLGYTFTPFAQDASKPAMAFAYEMNDAKDITGTASPDIGKMKNVGYIDGIGYFTNTAFGAGNQDFRLSPKTVTAKDASEYYIFQFREYAAAPTSTNLYYIPAGSSYQCESGKGCGKFHGPGTGGYKASDVWSVAIINLKDRTADMGAHAFGDKTVAPWDLSQLWLDVDTNLCTEAGQLDVRLDYLRLYRAGLTTVTYYNEDGSEILFKDEGRGVGTGYMLRSEHEAPVKAGAIFAGWADADGNVFENGMVDLTGDLDVYASYLGIGDLPEAPETDTINFSLRTPDAKTQNETALRFSASVAKADKADMDEYGFIVTTGEKMGSLTEDDFVIDGAVKSVKGIAYSKSEGIDLVYDEDSDNEIFVAACYGIKAGKYDVDILSRTYAIFNLGGRNINVYGAVATTSIKAVAEACKNAAAGSEQNNYYLANQEELDKIIANEAN